MMRFAALTTIVVSLACTLSAADESELQRYFEGTTVTVKLDLPGSSTGVNVYPERSSPVDFPKLGRDLKQYGAGVRAGESIMVTKVHIKTRHIEFQLGGGGFGTFADYMSSPSAPGTSYEGKSNREKELERQIKNEPDRARRRKLQDELDDLRRERERENRYQASASAQAQADQARDERERRAQGGSRFNIRYDGSFPPGALTPEAIMAALDKYVEFPAVKRPEARRASAAAAPAARPAAAPAARSAAGLKKGMSLQEVERLLGPATNASTEKQGSMTIASRTYRANGQRVATKFANDVLLEYTISSE